MAFGAEAFLYIYMGISVWRYTNANSKQTETWWSWTFVLSQIAICFIARFIGVFVLSWITILFKGRSAWKLNHYEMAIVWFAGVIRGSIAFALIQAVECIGGTT
jgi:NhaP-type Na+/H+ or K+/H+ antiporter